MKDYNEKDIIIENELYNAFRLFHEVLEPKEIKEKSKKLFEKFCNEEDLNREYVAQKLKNMFQNLNKETNNKYYMYNNIDDILEISKEDEER